MMDTAEKGDCFYVACGYQSSSVSLSLKGNFTASDSNDILVFKPSRLEVYSVTGEALTLNHTFRFNARIGAALLFTPRSDTKSFLAMVSMKCQFSIVEFVDGGLRCVAQRIIGDYCSIYSCPLILLWDPEHQVFGACCSEPKIKLLKWYQEKKNTVAIISYLFKEESLLTMAFLPGCAKPTVAAIVNDSEGTHVRTFEIDDSEKELKRGPWAKDRLDADGILIVAVPPPLLGVLIVNYESVVYLNVDLNVMHRSPLLQRKTTLVPSCCPFETANSYLIADIFGRLYEISLVSERSRCVKLDMKLLGYINEPTSLCYYGDGILFNGSAMSDSQLIEVRRDPIRLHVLDSFSNLGPVVDLKVFQGDSSQHNQIITCSSNSVDGALHIINSGIGFKELMKVRLPGVKAVWALRYGDNVKFDNLIVVSFVAFTKSLLLVNDEIEDVQVAGIEYNDKTLCMGNVFQDGNEGLFQVTPTGVRLLDNVSGCGVDNWQPLSDENRINLAACHRYTGQILLSCRANLTYLAVQGNRLTEMGYCKFEHEISCLYVCDVEGYANLACVGLWTEFSVMLIDLPSMEVLHKELLGGEVIPRSLLVCRFEQDSLNLLIGMGDGTLLIYSMDKESSKLGNRTSFSLGNWPLSLKAFPHETRSNVMACSDRCSVVYSNANKLTSCSVSVQNISCIAPWHHGVYKNCCIYCRGEYLCTGIVEDVQRLHIRRVPLGEQPINIAHQPETGTYGLVVVRPVGVRDEDLNGMQRLPASETARQMSKVPAYKPNAFQAPPDSVDFLMKVSHFLVLDHSTFDVLYAYRFEEFELGGSVASCQFGVESTPYFAVTSGLISPLADTHSHYGRLMVLQYNRDSASRSGTLVLACSEELTGLAERVEFFRGNLLILLKESVRFYSCTIDDQGRATLNFLSSVSEFVHLLELVIREDMVMTVDVQHSLSLLNMDSKEKLFTVACDPYPKWLTHMAFISDDSYVFGDTYHNIYSAVRLPGQTGPGLRDLITMTGCYHLGEFVSHLCRGWLFVPNTGNKADFGPPPVIYGTSQGSIGIICQLSRDDYTILKAVQKRMAKALPDYGFELEEWRSLDSSTARMKSDGFVDGDTVECLLSLPTDRMRKLLKEVVSELSAAYPPIHTSEGDILALIQDMSKMH